MIKVKKVGSIVGVVAFAAVFVALLLFVKDQFGFKQVPYTCGTMTGNIYMSTLMQYKFTVPEGCRMAELEELAKDTGIVTAGKSEEQIMAELVKEREIIDLKAEMPSGVTVIVDANMDSMVTEKRLEFVTKDMMETLRQSGFIMQGDAVETTFCGKKACLVECTQMAYGQVIKQECYVMATDGCAYAFMFVYTDDTVADKELLKNAFSPL